MLYYFLPCLCLGDVRFTKFLFFLMSFVILCCPINTLFYSQTPPFCYSLLPYKHTLLFPDIIILLFSVAVQTHSCIPRPHHFVIPRHHHFVIPRHHHFVIPRDHYFLFPETTILLFPETTISFVLILVFSYLMVLSCWIFSISLSPLSSFSRTYLLSFLLQSFFLHYSFCFSVAYFDVFVIFLVTSFIVLSLTSRFHHYQLFS